MDDNFAFNLRKPAFFSAAGAFVHLPGRDAGMSALPWME
jgi:hypothetical protein